MYTLKKIHLLFAALPTALLLAGCVKNDPGVPNEEHTPATHISAKATGAESAATRAPLAGTSFNGKQALVYTTTSPLDNYAGDKTRMFTGAYAAGTMTFADNSYSQYDPAGFSGSTLLPTDKSAVYLYGFYPADWTTDNTGTYQSLQRTFDGKTDLMATWVTAADQIEIAYGGGTSGATANKADCMFRHLLTCYNIRVMGADADQAAKWGRIKSVALKNANVNKVATAENFGYTYSAGGGTAVSFYKLGGTTAAPAYTDNLFEQAAFADMLALTTTAQPACYAMAAPVTVDVNTTTAELTFVIVTVNTDGGKETTVEIPVSLDQSKFAANGNSTRGYTVTITLNFTAEAIAPTASVGDWAAGGTYDQELNPLPPPKAGDFYYSDGRWSNGANIPILNDENGNPRTVLGIVFWVGDPTSNTNGDPLLKRNHPDCTHGLVVALQDISVGPLFWSENIDNINANWLRGQSSTYGITDLSNRDRIQGYANTEALNAYNTTSDNVKTNPKLKVLPIAALEQYNRDYPTPLGSSHWYVPSVSELKNMCWGQGNAQGTAGVMLLQTQFAKAGVSSLSGIYWSSSESNIDDRAWCVTISNGDYNGFYKNSNKYAVRAVLAF